jgi:hypothetical protein
MSSELTKLSETRWRYATDRRVFYVKQLKAPNEDTGELGRYRVDAGGDDQYVVTASALEPLLLALGHDIYAPHRSQ